MKLTPILLFVACAAMLGGCFGQPSKEEVRAHTDAQEKHCDRLRRDIRSAERDGNPLRQAQLQNDYQRDCLRSY